MNFDKHLKIPMVRSIKLVSGEEIVAMVQPDTDDDFLLISHPFSIRMIPHKTSSVFGFFPWLIGASTDVVPLGKSAIATMADVKNEVAAVYFRALNTYSVQSATLDSTTNDISIDDSEKSDEIEESSQDHSVEVKRKKKKPSIN